MSRSRNYFGVQYEFDNRVNLNSIDEVARTASTAEEFEIELFVRGIDYTYDLANLVGTYPHLREMA